MALINCPECGNQMSDTAKKCPHCGYKTKKINKKIILGIILAIIGIIAFVFTEFFLAEAYWESGDVYISDRYRFTLSIILFICMVGILVWSATIFAKQKAIIKNIIVIFISLSTLFIAYQLTIQTKIATYASADRILDEMEKSITLNNLKNVKSVNEFEELIDGTTWHFTQNLNKTEIPCWIMVTFDNGKYKTYYANPSDGYWTEGGNGEYVVEESRYSNTGEKFYVIVWEGQMQLIKGFDISGTFALTHNGEFYIHPFVGPVVSGIMEYGNYEWK